MTKHGLSLLDRIESHYIPEPNSGCWLWVGALRGAGYPVITHKNGSRAVHRIMYVLHKGEIGKNLEVRHTCDVPICVNPDHLVTGTHTDNMRDASTRKRFTNRSGENNITTKLTWGKVREIRASSVGSNTLARNFGVDRSLIWLIRSNKVWIE